MIVEYLLSNQRETPLEYRTRAVYANIRTIVRVDKYEVISKTPVRHVERSQASIAVLVVCANYVSV